MLHLRPLQENAFSDFLAFTIEEYAKQIATNFDLPLEKARQVATAQTTGRLAEGINTPDNYFYHIEREEESEREPIGYLWYSIFVLRQCREGWQILAFRHPKAGTQLIKGTLETGEHPEVGVLRELAEESGITQATVVTKIGDLAVLESEQYWHIYLCQPTVDPPEHWPHFTTDGGGLTFQFFWHPLVERGDESWHAHFCRALAFIHNWQEGRKL